MEELINKIEIDTMPNIVVTRKELKDGEYIETIGRRKTATARIRITPGAKNVFTINGKTLGVYFQTDSLQDVVKRPLTDSSVNAKFNVSVVVKGGGSRSQAEAIRHGVARALVEFDSDLRKGLKKLGFLKRDPRKKERKKFGLKKARRAPQWSKR